jgi:prephenate dehydratase
MPPALSTPTRDAEKIPRAGYLGPEGTFSEEALLSSLECTEVRPVGMETIRDTLMAVQSRAVEWGLVPIENSIEGSVTVTLDTLARDAREVAIVGEVVLPVRHNLVAGTPLRFEHIETVVSHPHAPGQCTRFLREILPGVQIVAATSTAEAVRLVCSGEDDSSAAIGTRLAAELYGGVVIAEGIQDREDNETRFVWLARTDSPLGAPPLRAPTGTKSKTSLVFWGAGADRAGWLVLCLSEFAKREINLTKIESRPMREQLGHYMFFVDLEGSLSEQSVSEALAGLRARCEQVRVFGSYPAA